MAYDLESILKFQNPFGSLAPLTEAQKEERRKADAKAFEEDNYRNACSELAKKL